MLLISHKLSIFGCRILLTKILRYSNKKDYKIPRKMNETDRKKDFYEAAYVQLFLETKEYSIIFLDEFYINMRSECIYNWSPR